VCGNNAQIQGGCAPDRTSIPGCLPQRRGHPIPEPPTTLARGGNIAGPGGQHKSSSGRHGPACPGPPQHFRGDTRSPSLRVLGARARGRAAQSELQLRAGMLGWISGVLPPESRLPCSTQQGYACVCVCLCLHMCMSMCVCVCLCLSCLCAYVYVCVRARECPSCHRFGQSLNQPESDSECVAGSACRKEAGRFAESAMQDAPLPSAYKILDSFRSLETEEHMQELIGTQILPAWDDKDRQAWFEGAVQGCTRSLTCSQY
jgi:hypothetical protein